jgi:hypothetical protein
MMPDSRPPASARPFSAASPWLLLLAGLLILALCTWAAYHQTHQANQGGQGKTEGAGSAAAGWQGTKRPPWLPDPRLTPGAVFPHVLADDICRPGYARAARRVRESTKREACRLYGVSYPAKGYEIDHLISLELGGAADDVRNLFPQPGTGKWTYHHKDQLENNLHRRVCSGELTLREAQDLIRGGRTYDWTLAYRKYVSAEPKVMGAGVEAEPESP